MRDPSRALEGRDHICFGHDWTGDPLSKTHLMRAMASEGRVLWINSIGYRAPTASTRDIKRIFSKLKQFATPVREVEKNLWVLSPVAIPAYGVPGMQEVNRQILRLQIRAVQKKLGFSRVINWVFNPAGTVVAGSLGEDKIVYYCVDEFTAYSDAGTPALVRMEKELLEKADLTVVSAQSLLDSKSKLTKKCVLIRHGVRYDVFKAALDPATKIPDEIASLPKPVIGYFGLMADDWIDNELLIKVAKAFPNGSLVLLGKVTTDMSKVTALPNVHLLGRKPFEALPGYCKGFDVALNAFPINDVTLNANPLKVREYLAAGLPVVSSRIPEVEVLGDKVFIADNHEEFVAKVKLALEDPGPTEARSLSMKDETWKGRYEDLKRALVETGTV